MSTDAGPAPSPALLVVHVESALEPRGRAALHRTVQPCRALGELEHVAVVSGSLLSPALVASGLLDDADVLVLADAADPDLLPIVESRRRRQRLTVFDLDTHLLSPPAGAPTAARARDLVRRSVPPQLARLADCVQLATPALEARFGFLNARRAVFPSQLWDAPAPPAARAHAPGRVVIGWGGGPGHAEDIRAVAPALAAVLARHAEVDVAVMGDAWLAEALAALPRERLRVTPAGSADGYARFLGTIDIGLAPLAPTEFNRCRSDVRFLEYAAHGVLAVCADDEPYRHVVRGGHTGFVFGDAAALEGALERALAAPEAWAGITQRAARFVGEERLERPHASDRLAFYLAIANQLGRTLAPHAGAEALARARGAPARFAASSRSVTLGGSEVEAWLAEGLAARRAGQLADARRCFTEARRRDPRAYMPELLLGETEEDPTLSIEALARAGELNPRSCHAPYLMGLRLGYAGAHDLAAAALSRARAIAPSFGAPQERLGELAEAAGRVEEACQLYEEAALQNGSYALPIARLADTALRAGRVDKAVGLLERSLEEDPELWLTNLVVGRAYLAQRRFHQARAHLRRALAGAEDRGAVLREIAKAEVGLGDLDAARMLLEEARRPDPG